MHGLVIVLFWSAARVLVLAMGSCAHLDGTARRLAVGRRGLIVAMELPAAAHLVDEE